MPHFSCEIGADQPVQCRGQLSPRVNPAEHTAADPRGQTATPGSRNLARFRLLHHLGSSERSTAWRVSDPRHGDAANAPRFVLLMPRAQPIGGEACATWLEGVRRAARLRHPNLAAPIEVGEVEHWPFALYEAGESQTLGEHLRSGALAASEAAELLVAVLQGLAYAHEGGLVHGDLQPYLLLLGAQREVRVIGLEAAGAADGATAEAGHSGTSVRTSVEALALQSRRAVARHDVLCAGLLLHLALSGKPALDEADIGAVAERLPPLGRELVRLPWDLPQPVPEALRAIANRATDRQERQRYRSARGLSRALEGWLIAEGASGGGPLALLMDRLHSVGALPASPGGAARSARLATMDRQRTNELAEVVLQDLGLSFELLRLVNSAQVRGAQVAGSGPVLTLRRAIAMLGIDGVRRATLGLRPWPGPLSESAAQDLRVSFDAARRAGQVAQALRPAGYDAEVVYLVCLLQNLGRLITGYHFPDELQQIRRLMQPAPGPRQANTEEPGMSEQSAAYAVLGADVETIGAAVARHWGLGDAVLHLMRRLPLATQPRSLDNDDDVLRAAASCGNEAVDACALPTAQRQAALRRVAQRYARVLKIELRDLEAALKLPSSRQDPQQAANMQMEQG